MACSDGGIVVPLFTVCAAAVTTATRLLLTSLISLNKQGVNDEFNKMDIYHFIYMQK